MKLFWWWLFKIAEMVCLVAAMTQLYFERWNTATVFLVGAIYMHMLIKDVEK